MALTTGDGANGDGLGVGAVVVGTAAIVDGGTALGVVLGADGAGAHAEPSKAIAINKRRITVSIPISCAACACYVAENAYVRCRS